VSNNAASSSSCFCASFSAAASFNHARGQTPCLPIQPQPHYLNYITSSHQSRIPRFNTKNSCILAC
jgi:hypothetical protein